MDGQILRLTEKHYNYGHAGLLLTPDEVKALPYGDRALFEVVENELEYTAVEVYVYNHKFDYLVFTATEMAAVVMKYLEPVNRKHVHSLKVRSTMDSYDFQPMHILMLELFKLYPFNIDGYSWGWEAIYLPDKKESYEK